MRGELAVPTGVQAAAVGQITISQQIQTPVGCIQAAGIG
ncbi:Large exoprotein involved in heme utilization or adhesion, partial [Yersinia ruckeri ATCC 29473]